MMTTDILENLEATLGEVLPQTVEHRHEIHAWPEPGYEEVRTAESVIRHLQNLPGMRLRTGVARTGIVADLEGGGDAPLIALRADMDCLEMEDRSDRPWASRRPGFAHTCGHDGHTATLTAAARILARHRESLPGPVRFIFQPAEEGLAGGRLMVQEGALQDPPVSMIFGLHGNPFLKIGQYGIASGPVMAASDQMQCTIVGQGAHAAQPHLSKDPILAASHLVCALQSMVSRRTDPIDSAVVTVAKIAGGSAFNIIPDQVHLLGTIRSLTEETRVRLHREVAETMNSIARAFGCTAEINLERGYPVCRNASEAVSHFRSAFEACLRPHATLIPTLPIMSGEDFAFFSQEIPGALFFVGVCPEEENNPAQWHQAHYDFHDEALPHSIRAMVALALQPR